MNKAWKGKNVLILGLGQYPQGSGISGALYAVRMGANVRVTDTKTEQDLIKNVTRLKKYKNVEFILGEHRKQDITWADIVIRNPAIRANSTELSFARNLGKRLESDVSLFLARCPAQVIGITGTRGKSTTTTLVHDILKKTGRKVWIGGNILVSPLTFIDKVKKDDFVVLELSSWQLETTGLIGLSPQIACITNLMRDHLNTYDGMEAYAEAKAQIFRHQQPGDTVVLNGDDANCKKWANQVPGNAKFFTKKKKKSSSAWLDKESLWVKDKQKEVLLIKRKELKVYGEHNALNAIAAALTAQTAGASVTAIRTALKEFNGIADRQELIAKIMGVDYVNDTTATTPDGVIAAIQALAPRYKNAFFIMGGNDKELEYELLTKQTKKFKIQIFLLPGSASDKMRELFLANKITFQDVPNLKQALISASNVAKKGDAIILSPGGTSFGQFKNEFDRGEQFRKIITDILKEKKNL
ncbi:UDP-N-acetylmuramoyl-L-alanine--D-glutamate ligase [Candidatus Uhrbacteria bacterium]|nr:UDP-N-acetylmuramoyl-L-alanine--D-glutamate ligase [Candidatus Uhrbacteria bacterium]